MSAVLCVVAAVGCEPKDKAAGPTTTTTAGPQTRPAPRPPAEFLAAVGSSRNADALAAAEEAASQALARFKASGLSPAAAVFLERSGASPELGRRIGRRISQLAGAPTFGHGTKRGQATFFSSAAARSPQDTEGTKSSLSPFLQQDADGAKSSLSPFLTVLVVGGEGLAVKGYAAGGRIEHDDGTDPAEAVKAGSLREACGRRGEALGRQVGGLERGGLVLLLGALGGDWHANFCTALHKQLGVGAAIVGGVGTWDDYVYVDGRELLDAAGRKTAVGQLAVVIQGGTRAAVQPVTFSNRWSPTAVLSEAGQACADVSARLAAASPKLILAFGCAEGAPSAAGQSAALRRAFGPDVPVFGGTFSGQVGTDAEGRLSVGADRLVVCAVAAE